MGAGFMDMQQPSSPGHAWLLKTQSPAGASGHFDGSTLFSVSLIYLAHSPASNPALLHSSPVGLKRLVCPVAFLNMSYQSVPSVKGASSP